MATSGLKEYLILSSEHNPSGMSVSRYVLENGSDMASEPLTEEQRDIVFEIVSQFEPQAKECFFNAMYCCMVSVWDSDILTRIKYCEGYVQARSPFPVHHAWITVDGKVVDLTLSTQRYTNEQLTAFMEEGVALPRESDLSDRVLGEIPEGWEYYGVQFDAKNIAQSFIERRMSFSVIDDWERGWPLFSDK